MIGEGGGEVGDGPQVLGSHQSEGFKCQELGGLEAHQLADLRDCSSGYSEPELVGIVVVRAFAFDSMVVL